MDMQDFQTKLFAKAKTSGFLEMEIYYSATKSTTVNVLHHEVKSYGITEQKGVSFRGIYKEKMGYSYTEKIDEGSIELLVTEAMENAESIEMDDKEELYAGAQRYETVNQYAEEVTNISPQALIETAFTMENTALQANPFVKRVIQCSVAKSEGERLIANTKGLHCTAKYTNVSAGIYLMANDGTQTATGYESDFTWKDFGDINSKEIAEKAAKEALSKLGADSIDTGNYPIILRYDTATQLLNSFVGNFSGEVVEKGFSRLQGKLGEKIAGDNITIIDDPFMPNAPGATAFDGEGYPTRRNHLVKEGILQSFLHNRKTAKNAGTESTGNAVKGGYSAPLSVGPHNLYIQPGSATLTDLIQNMEKGIFIVELQGTNAGINAVSGDFSLSAIGFLVENGKIGRPINQITLAGNLYEVLHNIEVVADDLHVKGTVSSPSLKITALTVSGK